MSGQHIPQRLDPYKHIGSGKEVLGQLRLDLLPRLEGLLADPQGVVDVSLRFYRDEQHIAVVAGTISSELQVTCQRCLKADALTVKGHFAFALLRDEKDMDSLPDAYEPMVLALPELDVHALVEEELILSLPIVHYHSQPCEDGVTQTSFGRLSGEDEKRNPFAVLEKLKT